MDDTETFQPYKPSQLQDYFDKLLPLVLGAEDSDLETSLWSANDTTEKLNHFINDPQVNVIYFTKKREDKKGKDEQTTTSYSYICSQEITYNSSHVATIAFIKHVPTLGCSRTIQSQIQLINLLGPASNESGSTGVSPYEALHSYIHLAAAPYFDAYIREKMGTPMAKKKITELKLSPPHLQQNVEIPEISLNIHPIVQRTVDMAVQEGKRASVDMIDQALLTDSIFLNKLQGDVNGWIKEIKKVTKLDHDPSSGTAIQEINFWLSMEKALERIDEKLKEDHIELTLSILRHAKYFHATVSFIADIGLKEAMDKARKYNLLMKGFPLNDLLSAPDVNKVKESLIAIFTHLRKLKLSAYPIKNVLQLVDAISRDLNDQLLRVLVSKRLMYMDYDEFERVMAGAEDVFRTWDEMIKEFATIARDITRKRSDKFIPIKFKSAHDKLQERVSSVRNFRKKHEQLHQTIDMNAMEEVTLAYESVKDIDVLDVSIKGAEIWMQAENSYNERVSRVENKLNYFKFT